MSAPHDERGSSRLYKRIALSAATALVLATLIGTLLAGSGSLASGTAGSGIALVGQPAPDLVGTTLEGDHLDLRRLRGSVVVVNIWASWCEPCRDELPLLAATAGRLRSEGVRVVGVNYRDGREPARRMLADAGATEEISSVHDPDGRLGVAWGVRGVPETFVVDRGGVVRGRRIGAVDGEWIARFVEALARR